MRKSISPQSYLYTTIAIIALAFMCLTVMVLPDVRLVYLSCSGDVVDPLTPHQDFVRAIVPKIIRQVPLSQNSYFTDHDMGQSQCWGRGWCRQGTWSADCRDCLNAAHVKLAMECESPDKAMIGLIRCGFRYDDQPFDDKWPRMLAWHDIGSYIFTRAQGGFPEFQYMFFPKVCCYFWKSVALAASSSARELLSLVSSAKTG